MNPILFASYFYHRDLQKFMFIKTVHQKLSKKALYKIHISGRVQGVGFRQSAKTMARFLGLKGFVKNLSDGKVYVEAEGNRDSLDSFMSWCRKGPGYGFVEKVEKTEDNLKDFESFEIKY